MKEDKSDRAVNNLAYASVTTAAFIKHILNNQTAHSFTQDVIRTGLHKDCVDAVHDVQLALDALKMIADDILSH